MLPPSPRGYTYFFFFTNVRYRAVYIYIFCLFDSIVSVCMLLHGLPIQLWLVLDSFNFLGGEKTIPVFVIRFIITSINKRAAGKRAFSLLIMRLYSRRIGKWFEEHEVCGHTTWVQNPGCTDCPLRALSRPQFAISGKWEQ